MCWDFLLVLHIIRLKVEMLNVVLSFGRGCMVEADLVVLVHWLGILNLLGSDSLFLLSYLLVCSTSSLSILLVLLVVDLIIAVDSSLSVAICLSGTVVYICQVW